MPSMKVMPSVESDPDWTTSPLLTLSPWFRMIETPLRIAVAVPVELGDVTDDLGHAGAAVGLRELGVAGQRVDDVAGEVGAIGRGQRRPLLALEVIVQHHFVAVAGQRRGRRPTRLKSPVKSRCASGMIMASAGAWPETVPTWTCPPE